jgi:hypothetical protein
MKICRNNFGICADFILLRLKLKCTLHKDAFRASQEAPRVSIRKTQLLMLYGEVIFVFLSQAYGKL